MQRPSILTVLALAGLAGACRSSFRLEVPADHPAHPEAASARPIEVPDPFTLALDEARPAHQDMESEGAAGDPHSMHGGDH